MGKSNAHKFKSSNVSSSSKPASTQQSYGAHKSSILRSSFCPSRLQLYLFASVIRDIEAEQIRIHDTQTRQLKCHHSAGPAASVTCIDWGYYGAGRKNSPSQASSKKRRKLEPDSSTAAGPDITLAYGTSSSDIRLISLTDGNRLGTLEGGHTHGIRDFKFVGDGVDGRCWSLGGDSRLVQWDFESKSQIRTLSLSSGPANVIQPLKSSVIYASHLAYVLDLDGKTELRTFNASTNAVRHIISHRDLDPTSHKFLTAARYDRCLSVFSTNSATLDGTLCTESEVLHVDMARTQKRPTQSESSEPFSHRLMHPRELIAIVNHDGVLELFPEPFDFTVNGTQRGQESIKARRQQRTRNSTAQLKFRRADATTSSITLINVSLRGSYLTVAWAEGGVNVAFDTVQWQNEENRQMLFDGFREITTEMSTSGMETITLNGIKDMTQAHHDESNAVVTNGLADNETLTKQPETEVIAISSGEDGSDSSLDETDSIPHQSTNTTSVPDTYGDPGVDIEMEDSQDPATALKNGTSRLLDEPSFGEMLRAAAPDPIDVVKAFPDPSSQSLIPATSQAVQRLPSRGSLGTVLTQSLRTNDKHLLEDCLRTKNLSLVRATVERLSSTFAPLLLQRLAERLHSRPGRAGSLMVWVQWTVIVHGGYLNARPEVVKTIRSLQQVLKARANGLQPLLSLKGKLDMLEAQVSLRRSMQAKVRASSEDDGEAMVYVEGQSESDSDPEEDEDAMVNTSSDGIGENPTNHLHGHDLELDSGTEMPLANGHLSESDSRDSGSDEGPVFDEEASSTDADSGVEAPDEVDYDDVDTESSEGEVSPVPRRAAI